MSTRCGWLGGLALLVACGASPAPSVRNGPVTHVADRDGDGIVDARDACPMVPEDHDGQFDDDGCPESDGYERDGDGIADAADLCPDDPEDRDGFRDEDGCPDPDNDADGILDANDQCPDVPEPINGQTDTDGCPP